MKILVAVAFGALFAAGAVAQDAFPSRPITMAVTFANVLVVHDEVPVRTLAAYIKREHDTWARVVKEANITAN